MIHATYRIYIQYMYSLITYNLKQCEQNHRKKTSVYFKLHQLSPQIFSQFLGEASWKKSWGGYVKCPMQSHPWLYRPAADGKQLYWDCLKRKWQVVFFGEPIRDMEWTMYICICILFSCVTFFSGKLKLYLITSTTPTRTLRLSQVLCSKQALSFRKGEWSRIQNVYSQPVQCQLLLQAF